MRFNDSLDVCAQGAIRKARMLGAQFVVTGLRVLHEFRRTRVAVPLREEASKLRGIRY
jgi:hypothetical protein